MTERQRCDCPAHVVTRMPHVCEVCEGLVVPDPIDLLILDYEERRRSKAALVLVRDERKTA